MRTMKRLLAIVYILSIFMGIVHEVSHSHHLGENCNVCTLSHTPAVPVDAPSKTVVTQSFAEYIVQPQSEQKPLLLQARSRAPPLA